jgi:hypothetical protein
MLDATRDDEQLAGPECHDPIPQTQLKLALKDEEEVVGVVMLVPYEFPLDLHHHDVALVEPGHRPRLPVVGEASELVSEVDPVANHITSSLLVRTYFHALAVRSATACPSNTEISCDGRAILANADVVSFISLLSRSGYQARVL